MGRALINVPATAKRGDIIDIKTLVAHPMETGYRHDTNGRVFPRNIMKEIFPVSGPAPPLDRVAGDSTTSKLSGKVDFENTIAIFGSSGNAWTVVNQGTVTAPAVGVYLQGGGSSRRSTL